MMICQRVLLIALVIAAVIALEAYASAKPTCGCVNLDTPGPSTTGTE